MIRRLVISALVVGSTGFYALAASERATLVLTDGERKSGALAYHLDKAETIINNMFQINVAPGQEIQLPMAQIAVVEFLGGQPPVTELAALPPDNLHMIVMRNGSTQRGHLLNLTGGDTVKWQNESGQALDLPIRDVSRIYLNPSVARSVFNYQPTASGTPGQAPSVGEVRVLATQAWTDTGVSVKKGDRVAFHSTGQIHIGPAPGLTVGPDGNDQRRSQAYPVPSMGGGGLIAKVVPSGVFQAAMSRPFPIGANSQPIVMPADGRLMLGVNDNDFAANSGSFGVTLAR